MAGARRPPSDPSHTLSSVPSVRCPVPGPAQDMPDPRAAPGVLGPDCRPAGGCARSASNKGCRARPLGRLRRKRKDWRVRRGERKGRREGGRNAAGPRPAPRAPSPAPARPSSPGAASPRPRPTLSGHSGPGPTAHRSGAEHRAGRTQRPPTADRPPTGPRAPSGGGAKQGPPVLSPPEPLKESGISGISALSLNCARGGALRCTPGARQSCPSKEEGHRGPGRVQDLQS